jgi:hypothetical protein
MAAAPKGGTVLFVGRNSKATYPRAFYNVDVANTLVRWDNGGGQPTSATGGTDSLFFDEEVDIVDISVVTGVVDTGSLRVVANFQPTGNVLLWANHLNTLATRPTLRIGFKKGTRISLMSVLPAA